MYKYNKEIFKVIIMSNSFYESVDSVKENNRFSKFLKKINGILNEDIYQDNGYDNRRDYLKSLADDFGVEYSTVLALAEVLGPEEDFDGLVSEIEGLSEF